MKTLEQVRAHVSETYYDCSEKICGFLVGAELKDPKRILGFKKGGDYIYNFDDFLEWFDDEEEEDVCVFCIGMIDAGGKIECNTVFEDKKEEKCCCGNCKCDKRDFKYQGEQRTGLEALLKNREDALLGLYKYAEEGTFSCIDVAIQCVRNEINDVSGKLQERVDEK